MHTPLLIGKFGRLSVSLNYSWLFISVLGLWGLAIIWLPYNYPEWSSGACWLVAVLIMCLYLLSLIAREAVRAAIAGFDRRGIVLYPFGAATPYRIDELGTGRVLASMLSAILFSLALGGGCLLLAGQLQDADSLGALTRAIAIPLGLINLWVGLINSIPGIPFDGGRILASALFWFSGQREQGVGVARAIGELTSIGLILFGAWLGLTSQDFVTALVLIVVGWSAREAEEQGKQLSILRTGLSQMSARDVMEETLPQDSVPVDASVAAMVYSHPYYPVDKPLPVMKPLPASCGIGKASQEMVGVIRLSRADDLLQGTWPTTPVLSLMDRTDEIEAFAPDTPLVAVVDAIEQHGSNPDEQKAIPVIENHRLVGSVNPLRLAAFEQAEFELGAPEAPIPAGSGFLKRLKVIVPAIAVLAVLAILANIAVNSDPYRFRTAGPVSSGAPITFSTTVPQAGARVPDGDTINISAIAIGVAPITTASLSLDGKPLEVQLTGQNSLRVSIASQVLAVADGTHSLTLLVADRYGRLGRTDWQFRVGQSNGGAASRGPRSSLQLFKSILWRSNVD